MSLKPSGTAGSGRGINVVSASLSGIARIATLALFAASAAWAAPVTYVFSGTGTGRIGGKPFSNTRYTITLTGDTGTIDYTYQSLAEWRNAVSGTVSVKRQTATISEPILITSACGTGFGYLGIEKAPGGAPFAGFIFNVQGVLPADCLLGAAAPMTGLAATVSAFVDVASTKGPITLTSSSLVAYQAQTCTQTRRSCRKQITRSLRAMRKVQVE
jgi:hypothetical protein